MIPDLGMSRGAPIAERWAVINGGTAYVGVAHSFAFAPASDRKRAWEGMHNCARYVSTENANVL